MVPVLKNVREIRLRLKTTSPLPVVGNVIEKLVNTKFFDHLEKCSFFCNIQYGVRSSQATANPLTVVFDRIIAAFDQSRATQSATRGIMEVFDRA